MSRLRKASRMWRDDSAREAASRVMLSQEVDCFAVEPDEIFVRRAPLEIEIGAGKGEFIIEYASAHPERNFLAIELSNVVGQLLAVRCARAELPNVGTGGRDPPPLINLMLPDASVTAFHIYYPDPWPKERHIKHRMFTPTLAASIFRTVEPGAIACVATDVHDYAAEIFPMMLAAGFIGAVESAPGAERTGFARDRRAAG